MNTGDVYLVAYPFARFMATTYDMDGPSEFISWKPGVTFRACGYYGDESEAIANGIGSMTLTVVSVHKPGKYPERVFYVRQWTNPDGQSFGKTNLRVTTTQAFKRLASGYRHDYRVDEPQEGEIR